MKIVWKKCFVCLCWCSRVVMLRFREFWNIRVLVNSSRLWLKVFYSLEV